jgi:hypothetical protein
MIFHSNLCDPTFPFELTYNFTPKSPNPSIQKNTLKKSHFSNLLFKNPRSLNQYISIYAYTYILLPEFLCGKKINPQIIFPQT